VTSSASELADVIADRVPSITSEHLHRIVDAIYSLYHVREYSELTRNGFLTELLDGIREHAKPLIPDKEIPRLRGRFERLLSVKSLESVSKAISLQRDTERVYCESKIISDIRPVFGDDVKEYPVAAAILHTLILSYHENGDHKEFFITLDEVDLNSLQTAIKRAKNKADTITRLMGEAQLPRLGI
jgi:hypothetical protein